MAIKDAAYFLKMLDTMKIISAPNLLALLALAGSTFGTAAQASVLFDFEGTSTTSGSGALTSLAQTSGGLTATFTRPGSFFDIANLSGLAPASFGSRTLSPFADTSATPFIANFSKSLSAISFEAGDFGADSDTITLNVFAGANGTGALVGSATYDYGTASLPGAVATLSVSPTTSFMSAEFIGGSTSYPNSVYYDNFSATVAAVSAVPLPASAPMFGAALLAFAGFNYGMKRRVTQKVEATA